MFRLSKALLCLFAGVAPHVAVAHDRAGLARVDADASAVVDTRQGVEMTLSLSQGVPYRIFTLADPARLIVYFREVDWQGLDLAAFDQSQSVATLRAGMFQPGWSRLVAELDGPHAIEQAGLKTEANSGRSVLNIALVETSDVDFAAQSGAPFDPRWDLPLPELIQPVRARTADHVRATLDPGHGGLEPWAYHGARNDKGLILLFARDLDESITRPAGSAVGA